VTRLAHRFVVYMAAVTRFAFTKGGSRALPSYAPSLPRASDQALGRSYDSAQDLTLVPVRFLFENPPEPVKARSVCGLQPRLPPVRSRQLCHQIRTAVQF
jgi:hypothetical protein